VKGGEWMSIWEKFKDYYVVSFWLLPVIALGILIAEIVIIAYLRGLVRLWRKPGEGGEGDESRTG
jgi:hypothetical protein